MEQFTLLFLILKPRGHSLVYMKIQRLQLCEQCPREAEARVVVKGQLFERVQDGLEKVGKQQVAVRHEQ